MRQTPLFYCSIENLIFDLKFRLFMYFGWIGISAKTSQTDVKDFTVKSQKPFGWIGISACAP